MYPRRAITVDASLPSEADYWVPKPSEIDEEGYGLNFRDTYALTDVRIADARGVMDWERAAAEWVAEAAKNADEFEMLARRVEAYNPVDGAEGDMPENLQDGEYSLWGLELGVSGLSHLLAATKFYPAASCRSHEGHSWSAEPVVLFASDRERLRRLQPLVAESGCGLDVDASRGQTLFVAYAPSIFEVMNLAELLYKRRTEFRGLPKTNRRQSPPRLRLF